MDMEDMQMKLEETINNGGIPVYIVATTGTTDCFGINDVQSVKAITTEMEGKYSLKPIHICRFGLGGFYSLFRKYDFIKNPLDFEEEMSKALSAINEWMHYLYVADSLCFDFQKIGQTPYLTSLFLVKNGSDLGLLDL